MKPLWTFLRASLGFATDLFPVLLACRLSTLLTILGFVFFVLVGQGREFVEAPARPRIRSTGRTSSSFSRRC